jgi:hypothetical protein
VPSHFETSDAGTAEGIVAEEGSQLIPMMGTATNEHDTVLEQPRDAFSAEVQRSNLALPVPSGAVIPKVSLLGSADPPTSSDSGGSPAQPPVPPLSTVPSAVTNGTQYWTGADSKYWHECGIGDGAPTTGLRSAAVAYSSSRYGG